MEGTGVDFVKDSNGAVTAMIQHWTEGDRNLIRRKIGRTKVVRRIKGAQSRTR